MEKQLNETFKKEEIIEKIRQMKSPAVYVNTEVHDVLMRILEIIQPSTDIDSRSVFKRIPIKSYDHIEKGKLIVIDEEYKQNRLVVSEGVVMSKSDADNYIFHEFLEGIAIKSKNIDFNWLYNECYK